MKIGFTGTREGMTKPQKAALKDWIDTHEFAEWHHGSALGADEQAVYIVAHWLGKRPLVIAAHPCGVQESGSANAYILSAQKHKVKRPIERNWDIVDATEMLIATPKGPEELRSGTWATVRYARKLNRHILIIWPNGSVTEENAPARVAVPA